MRENPTFIDRPNILHECTNCWEADSDVLEIILDRRPDIDINSFDNGTTPLMKSLLKCRDNTGCIDLLLERGADVTLTSSENWSMLDFAIMGDHNKDIIEKLVNKGAPMFNENRTKYPNIVFAMITPLLSWNVAMIWMRRDYSVRKLDHCKKFIELLEFVKSLHNKSGSDRDFDDIFRQVDDEGECLLHWICGYGFLNECSTQDIDYIFRKYEELLQTDNTDYFELENDCGQTAMCVLHKTRVYEGTRDIDYGYYNPSYTDAKCRVFMRYSKLRPHLLATYNDKGSSYLHKPHVINEFVGFKEEDSEEESEGCSKKQLFKLYLDQGLRLNEQNSDGDTPIHRAVFMSGLNYNYESSKLWWIKAILSFKPNVNIQNNLGNTPLHKASVEESVLLISAGADLNIRNQEGKTPLEILETREPAYAKLLNTLNDLQVRNRVLESKLRRHNLL